MNTQHLGTSFDGFLLENSTVLALKRVVAWHIKKKMERQKIKKIWRKE